MTKEEFFNHYKDLILSYELRILKQNKQFAEDSRQIFKTDKQTSDAIRNFRRGHYASLEEKNVELTPNEITIKQERVTKTKNVILDIKPLITETKETKYEVVSQETKEITSKAKVEEIKFHSHYAREMQPVIKKLIDDSKSYLKHLQTDHLKDKIDVEKDVAKAVKDCKKLVEPFNIAFKFMQDRLITIIETSNNPVMDAENVSKIVNDLCKLADKISRIQNTLIYKTTTKYDIREKQTKEIATFIDSLVKMQMTIKGIFDNDVNIMQNGYIAREATKQVDIPAVEEFINEVETLTASPQP